MPPATRLGNRERRALIVLLCVIAFALLALVLIPSGVKLEGRWQCEVEKSLAAVTEVPRTLRNRFGSLDEYRTWLRSEVAGLEFEFAPNGEATIRRQGSWSGGRAYWRREGGGYWVEEPMLPLLRNPAMGHGFDLHFDGTATCRYQVQYDENEAPRSPLMFRKVQP